MKCYQVICETKPTPTEYAYPHSRGQISLHTRRCLIITEDKEQRQSVLDIVIAEGQTMITSSPNKRCSKMCEGLFLSYRKVRLQLAIHQQVFERTFLQTKMSTKILNAFHNLTNVAGKYFKLQFDFYLLFRTNGLG